MVRDRTADNASTDNSHICCLIHAYIDAPLLYCSINSSESMMVSQQRFHSLSGLLYAEFDSYSELFSCKVGFTLLG
jgi:hypothetical protein